MRVEQTVDNVLEKSLEKGGGKRSDGREVPTGKDRDEMFGNRSWLGAPRPSALSPQTDEMRTPSPA